LKYDNKKKPQFWGLNILLKSLDDNRIMPYLQKIINIWDEVIIAAMKIKQIKYNPLYLK